MSIYPDLKPDYSLSSYRFSLPEALIAHEPLSQRDDARLMVVHRGSKTIEHRYVRDLDKILNNNHVLVANNTQVFRARLLGQRVDDSGIAAPQKVNALGGRVEFFLLKKISNTVWEGLMRTSAKVQPGFKFKIKEIFGEVIERTETPSGALFTAKFSEDPLKANIGEVPLPPYIMARRKVLDTPQTQDPLAELRAYNTVYSKVEGSVAAPTAGRHFTPELISKLQAKGVEWNELTLHVGIGTFKPVEHDDIRQHQMHPESVHLSDEVAQKIIAAKKENKKIVAVGTTTARTLEGMAAPEIILESGSRDVNLFIHPGSGHQWQIVDALLTNFHLPESSLLMMVADFLGSREWALELYQEAIKHHYRFYSYGDAMLILE